jgi:signal peptidase I
MPKPRFNSWINRQWKEWIRSVLVIVVVITAFRSAVADWNDVPTGSMRPTILEGDRIVVNKLAYDLRFPFTGWHMARWDDPERGDIVVLLSPTDGKRLVKRVIGLPGDTVATNNRALIVNGDAVRYSPLPEGMVSSLSIDREVPVLAAEQLGESLHAVALSRRSGGRRDMPSVMVPEGQFFVMGDNRDFSLDSRHFGPVDRDLILGRATRVAASVDPSHHYFPRWDRFMWSLR